MRIFACLSAACLSVTLSAGSLLAAEAPDFIPSSAAGVIRLKAPDKTVKVIADFVDDIQPGFGGMIHGQAGMLGVGISNPTMQGVDKSKDFWGAVFLQEDEDPAVVFLIPAKDVDEMKEAIDESFEFISHEGFGIYTEDKEAAKVIRKHLENPRSESIKKVASAELATVVENADIAVAFNLEVIKEAYKEELAEGKEEFFKGMKESQEQMLEVPGVNLDWVPDLMKTFGDKLFVAVDEAEAYAVTLTVARTGLELQEYLEFKDGGESATYLAKNPPEALDVIKKFPAKQLFYGVVGSGAGSISQWGMSLVPQILELSEEQKKQWSEISEKAKKLTYGATGSSFALGDTESGLIRGTTIAQVAPVKTVREIASSSAETMDSLELPGGMKQEMSYDKSYEKVGDVEVDLMKTKQVMDDEQFGGFQAQINQILYGGEAIETRSAYLDGVVVSTVGGGKEAMKVALDAYKNEQTGADEVVTRDAKPLGEKNNFLGLVDIPTLIVTGLEIAATSPLLPPMPFDEDSIDNLEIERSYIGFAVETSKVGCKGKLHIPKKTLKAGVSLYGFFQQLQNNQNAF